MQHYGQELACAAQVHKLAGTAANRLLDRDLHHYLNVWSLSAQLLSSPQPWDPIRNELIRQSLPLIAAMLWDCMPLLGPRMEATQRLELCEASSVLRMVAISLHPVFTNSSMLSNSD